MGKFVLGVIVTLLVLILGGLGFAMLGFFPTNANVAPPRLEALRQRARRRLHGAPRSPRHQPVAPNDQNLEDGMKLYTMNCAVCHGGLDRKPASLVNSFIRPLPIWSPIRPTTPSGTSSTPSAPASATPACRPGKKLSASRTCGRSPASFRTWKNSHPPSRITGRQLRRGSPRASEEEEEDNSTISDQRTVAVCLDHLGFLIGRSDGVIYRRGELTTQRLAIISVCIRPSVPNLGPRGRKSCRLTSSCPRWANPSSRALLPNG